MLKRGDKGRNVLEVQSALVELGYDLPRFGIDGGLGGETLEAFTRFLAQHEGTIRDEDASTLSDSELALLFHVRDLSRTDVHLPAGYVDRRQFGDRKQDQGPRPWAEITGLCLHQTACKMGERDGRYDTLGAHAAITQGGKSIHVHGFDRLIWHGNRWNRGTIGIEFDGLFAGVEGDASTVWNDPSTPQRETPSVLGEAQVKAGLAFGRWAIAEVARHGGRVRVIVAHRQASKSRENDPGSAIWQAVALPLMADFGLTDGGAGYTVGGLPIPEQWDATRRGIRY